MKKLDDKTVAAIQRSQASYEAIAEQHGLSVADVQHTKTGGNHGPYAPGAPDSIPASGPKSTKKKTTKKADDA